jgi:glycine cleavage system H protein
MTYSEAVRYQQSHEWARQDGDLVVVGISDYAQDSLGDVVYVEFPEIGTSMKKGDPFGVIESVKAASDVYMPVSGEIVEVNEVLEDNPGTVNEAPFDAGWLMKIKPSDPSELDSLMTAEAYKRYTEEIDE